MVLSRTAHYALRAVYYVASQPDKGWSLVKEIAEATGIPRSYLARILSTLAKCGLLDSRTGINGGFRLAGTALDRSLLDVVCLFDDLEKISDCVFGFSKCCESGKCSLHSPWSSLKSQLLDLLRSTTMRDLRGSFKKFDWSRAEF